MSEGRELGNPQNVAEIDEPNAVEVGEASNAPAKVMSVLQNVPMSSEIVTSGKVEKDDDLIIDEKDCVMTSSEEDLDDLKAFVNEKLQNMTEKCLEQHVGVESLNVEEILGGNVAAVSCPNVGSEGNVGTEEVNQGRTTSVCPGLIQLVMWKKVVVGCLLMNVMKWIELCEKIWVIHVLLRLL